MKRNIILMASILISGAVYSQVGIDTDAPKATLDIVLKSDKLSKPFGLIAPRVTGNDLKNADGQFSAAQNAAIVYVTSIPSTTSKKTANVTSIGYYYFDSTLDGGNGQWVKMTTSGSTSTEPWNEEKTTNPATSNTQNIYQKGNVGIGDFSANNASVSYPLHIEAPSNGTFKTAAGIFVPNMEDGNDAYILLGKANDRNGGTAYFSYNYKSSDPKNNSALRFGIGGGTLGTTLLGNGNFGIGKVSPLTKLDVAGAARIGYHNDASATVGSNSLAVGAYNVASGENSFAQGNSATASGTNSVALGSRAKAGLNSYAIGRYADASQVTDDGELFAIGTGVTAAGNDQLALGRYNAPSTAAVVVGIGDSNSRRKNAVTIEKSGVVTILDNNGNNSNLAALRVDGRSSFNKPVYLKDQLYDNNNATGNDGQVLAKNGGKVRWVNNIALTPAVAAVFPRTARDMTWGQAGTTGAYIDLPTGKWSLQVTLLINTNIQTGVSGWFRCSFSESLNSTTPTSDLLGSRLASGSITGPTQFGLVNGTVIINNKSGATKRYYLFKSADTPYLFGNANASLVAKNFGRGVQGEDQIIAYPMN